jgi:hypothetical protein
MRAYISRLPNASFHNESYVYVCVSPSIHPPIHPFFCSFIHLFVCLPLCVHKFGSRWGYGSSSRWAAMNREQRLSIRTCRHAHIVMIRYHMGKCALRCNELFFVCALYGVAALHNVVGHVFGTSNMSSCMNGPGPWSGSSAGVVACECTSPSMYTYSNIM